MTDFPCPRDAPQPDPARGLASNSVHQNPSPARTVLFIRRIYKNPGPGETAAAPCIDGSVKKMMTNDPIVPIRAISFH